MLIGSHLKDRCSYDLTIFLYISYDIFRFLIHARKQNDYIAFKVICIRSIRLFDTALIDRKKFQIIAMLKILRAEIQQD